MGSLGLYLLILPGYVHSSPVEYLPLCHGSDWYMTLVVSMVSHMSMVSMVVTGTGHWMVVDIDAGGGLEAEGVAVVTWW